MPHPGGASARSTCEPPGCRPGLRPADHGWAAVWLARSRHVRCGRISSPAPSLRADLLYEVEQPSPRHLAKPLETGLHVVQASSRSVLITQRSRVRIPHSSESLRSPSAGSRVALSPRFDLNWAADTAPRGRPSSRRRRSRERSRRRASAQPARLCGRGCPPACRGSSSRGCDGRSRPLRRTPRQGARLIRPWVSLRRSSRRSRCAERRPAVRHLAAVARPFRSCLNPGRRLRRGGRGSRSPGRSPSPRRG